MALIIVAGNIGQDATFSEKDGSKLARFGVAESEKVKGEKVTTWYNCTAFGRTAEFCRDYVKKGRSVQVVGKPSARTFKNKLEEQIACIDVMVNDIKLFGSMRDGAEGGGQTVAAGPAPDKNAMVEVSDEQLPF